MVGEINITFLSYVGLQIDWLSIKPFAFAFSSPFTSSSSFLGNCINNTKTLTSAQVLSSKLMEDWRLDPLSKISQTPAVFIYRILD